MKYEIVITKIKSSRAKQVIAKHRASDNHSSLKEALQAVEKVPFVFMKNVSDQEIENIARSLKKMEIEFTIASLPQDGEKMMHIHSAGNEFLQSLFNSMSEVNSSPADKTVSRKIEFHSAAEKEKQESNGAGKMKLLRMATGTGIVILIIAGVFTYQKADRSFRLPFFLKTGKISPSNPKDTARPVPVSIDSYVHQDSIKNRIKIPPANKKQAESYCDSAALLARDIEKAIRFYSLAVSFNPYNLNAWQGLVLAYRAAYRSQEADETEARMKRLFGKNFFSIRNIVKPYGRLVEYSIDEKGTCRIAYTSSTLVRADLELETFRLIRALAVEKNFPTVVLYAATQKGSGMLVRIQTADFPLTVAEYTEKAMITFIQ